MRAINKEKQIVECNAREVMKEEDIDFIQTPSEILMELASEEVKKFVDSTLLSEEARNASDEGYIHINDKTYYPTKSLTCLQHPLDKVLKKGFKPELCNLRPAKRIETAGILTCILMEIVQNEMHGGQSIPAFDYYLAPYVRMTFKEEINKLEDFEGKDLIHLQNYEIEDYTVKPVDELEGEEKYVQEAINNTVSRVYQAMEAFINNMNTIHSRSGNRVIFSSINYGTDTSAEGRCIIRQLLLATERGVGNNETPIFPIQIWKKKKGINYMPEDRNYDLYKYACLVTSKRYFPNYINLDASFNKNEKWKEDDKERYKYECCSMGCRTRVFENRHGETTSIGRGNLSFSSINLPKIAIESAYEAQEKVGIKLKIGKELKESITDEYKEKVEAIFMEKLEKYIGITVRQLYDRYEFQCTAIARQFPLLMSGLWMDSENLNAEDKVKDVLKHGTLAVGYIGLAECLIALIGTHHGESKEAQDLGISIIKKMSEEVNKYADQYDLNFVLLQSPAERSAGKFAKLDAKKYGKIEGVTDRDYYTNSSHIPVWYECTANEKAKIEAPYHELTNGGHIFYIELDKDEIGKPENVEKVVDLMDEYNMGYGTVNFKKSKCPRCGFESEKPKLQYCPVCEYENVENLQRITGYLIGTTDRWNSSKLEELKDRLPHKI